MDADISGGSAFINQANFLKDRRRRRPQRRTGRYTKLSAACVVRRLNGSDDLEISQKTVIMMKLKFKIHLGQNFLNRSLV